MDFLELFISFARVGVLTFGGGYAMLPMLQRELVNKRKWVTEEEILDYFAIGQCTPGVIAVNTATFVGKKRKGVLGAICATLGIVFPSLVIITILAAFLSNFAELAVVKNAFAAIRVCVCVLVVNSVRKLLKKTVIDVPTGIIFALVVICTTVFRISPVIYVLISAIAGIAIKSLAIIAIFLSSIHSLSAADWRLCLSSLSWGREQDGSRSSSLRTCWPSRNPHRDR